MKDSTHIAQPFVFSKKASIGVCKQNHIRHTLVTLVLITVALLVSACSTSPAPEPIDVEATVQAALAAAMPNVTPDIQATIAAGVQAAIDQRADIPEVQATVSARVQATVQAISSSAPVSEPTATAVPTSTPPPTLAPEPTPTSIPSPTATLTATPIPSSTATAIPSPTATSAPLPTLSGMISKVEPAVVRVVVAGTSGSGFIYNSDGWVLTNAHVVGSYNEVTVVKGENIEYEGKVIGVDENVDLAVIKIETDDDLPVLSFGDSSSVSVGDDLIALGFPLGSILGNSISATKGVLSSKRNNDSVDYLQTDAAINPGNSGGPLLNSDGEVVGLNTSRVERILQRSVQGIGLAIASNDIDEFLPGLMAGAQVRNESAPPSISSPADRIYENEKYWYTVNVPAGWLINDNDTGYVVMREQKSFSTILIAAQKIDVEKYPTIELYTEAGWEPSPGNSWEDWRIINDGPIRQDMPVKAHEFVYRFTLEGERWRGRTQWYMLGDYRVRVDALAEEALWDSDANAALQLRGIQESFDPTQFTSPEYEYSLSHPLDWERVSDRSKDYRASDDSSSAIIYVDVDTNEDGLSILEYGSTHSVKDSEIEFSGLVFEDRPNPAYRIDYVAEPPGGLETQRGTALITLNGDKAIWVFVQTEADEWDDFEPVVDELLMRVAVKEPD